MSSVRTVMISVRMSPELKAVLIGLANQEGVPVSRWIARAAREEAKRIYRLGGRDLPPASETPNAA